MSATVSGNIVIKCLGHIPESLPDVFAAPWPNLFEIKAAKDAGPAEYSPLIDMIKVGKLHHIPLDHRQPLVPDALRNQGLCPVGQCKGEPVGQDRDTVSGHFLEKTALVPGTARQAAFR